MWLFALHLQKPGSTAASEHKWSLTIKLHYIPKAPPSAGLIRFSFLTSYTTLSPLAEQLRQQILTYAGWRQAFCFNFSQGEVNNFSVTNPESPIQNPVKGDSCTYRLYLQKPKSVWFFFFFPSLLLLPAPTSARSETLTQQSFFISFEAKSTIGLALFWGLRGKKEKEEERDKMVYIHFVYVFYQS